MWNSNHWYYQRVSKYKYAIAIQSMQSFFHFIVLEVHWQLELLVSSSCYVLSHLQRRQSRHEQEAFRQRRVQSSHWIFPKLSFNGIKFSIQYRVSQNKRTFRMLLEPHCTGSNTICRHPLCLEIDFFGRFLLSRIKRPHVNVKFSPIALNFGYNFVLIVHFFGTPCMWSTKAQSNI